MSDKNVKLERRVCTAEDVELRVTDEENPKIIGYPAKFNKWSLDLGGFKEKIKAGAFDEALKTSDVRALKNHDSNLILGRTKSGTLELGTNSVGLVSEINPPDTSTGRDVVEEIRRKDITGMSFAFTTAEDDWKYFDDGRVERTIIKVGELFDISVVTFPAYPDTSVAVRSMDAKKKELEQEKRENEIVVEKTDEEKIAERERQQGYEKSYRKAGRIIHRNKSA